jgi:hypothetical protein
VTDKEAFIRGGLLFQLIDDSERDPFIFSLSIQSKVIVFQRNDVVSLLTLEEANCQTYIIIITWTYTELNIYCSIGNRESDLKKAIVKTNPITPPNSLIRWARKNNLLPVEEFDSEEEFREKVHSCLASIQDKITEGGSFMQFWNIRYDGQKIIDRNPKREIEVQPIIHSMLSDQFLMSSIEIIPEYESAIGNLDFLFLAKIRNAGFAHFCTEFKNAHSGDKLNQGLTKQLPLYMENKKSRYGAFCVLDYRGEYFDRPQTENIMDLQSQLEHMRIAMQNPYTDNIRIFIYNLSKPKSASIR